MKHFIKGLLVVVGLAVVGKFVHDRLYQTKAIEQKID